MSLSLLTQAQIRRCALCGICQQSAPLVALCKHLPVPIANTKAHRVSELSEYQDNSL